MKTAILALACTLGVAAVAGGPSAPALAAPTHSGQANDEAPVVCAFRNTGYTGVCEEKTPYVKGKELKDLCRPILDCLNSPQCIKTYCGNTTIRQGWSLDSAKREK
jgi:hypothetical protein